MSNILEKEGLTLETTVLFKLCCSAIVGIILGFEREMKQKPLGIKTCLVISITSCLLTIVSLEAAIETNKGTLRPFADPMRLPAQIVSGIGFLGAGVILRRGNEIVSGLTTASIVWAAAGLGLCIGAGYYIPSLFGIILIIMSIDIIPYVRKKFGIKRKRLTSLTITTTVLGVSDIGKVIDNISNQDIDISNIGIKQVSEGHEVKMLCKAHQGIEIESIYAEIQSNNHVEKVKIESF
ncbi:MgtC/SapB family protein [Terrilactibacillus tamarindi]|uniref:MgtC/SapB family protein n=1 Tax=Terrilactibacillus tamarindi TaxID=2599694 RepID=UPI002E37BB81|nr:MgtC/SapB family protein [Terrilactibacillus tamarindi]